MALRCVRQRVDHINAGEIMTSAYPDALESHRFAIGNLVVLRGSFLMRKAVSGPYEVLAQLPEREGERQYRIKSEREPYQRIMKEDELDLA
jgi:hypothetical protein